MKFLIWFLVIVAVVNWLLRPKRTLQPKSAAAPSTTAGRQHEAIESMLPCRLCGMHVPASEAIVHASGATFCCDEHRRRMFSS
jgi:uncharacterized protein